MIKVFYKSFAIPEKCFFGKKIFKKLFLENGNLDMNDKKVIKDDILEIIWVYSLKPETLNIPPFINTKYNYDEIAIIQVNLIDKKNVNRIANFINLSIPYPTLLLFNFDGYLLISICEKRLNKNDHTKWILENIIMTEWIDLKDPNKFQQQFLQDINIKNLSFINLNTFYYSIMNRILALNFSSRNGIYKIVSQEKIEIRQRNLLEIYSIEEKINKLRSQLKNELQFNRKIDLNVLIKENEKIIQTLEKDL